MSYLRIFGQELEETTVLSYFASAQLNFSKHKISSKNKFKTKIALIGYFGLEFQKANAVFEVSIIEFVNIQYFIQKQKKIKLVTKIRLS